MLATDQSLSTIEKNIILDLYKFANMSGKLGEILMENEDESSIETIAGLHSLLEKAGFHEVASAFEGMIHSVIRDHLKGGH